MDNKQVINALEDMKRQIEAEQWTIFCNDRGSGSAGVRSIDDASIIEAYLHFEKTGDNSDVPNCIGISYIPVGDFGEEENEITEEIFENYGEYVEPDEILGFVVCHERYDMDYTFYLAHIKG